MIDHIIYSGSCNLDELQEACMHHYMNGGNYETLGKLTAYYLQKGHLCTKRDLHKVRDYDRLESENSRLQSEINALTRKRHQFEIDWLCISSMNEVVQPTSEVKHTDAIW